MLRVLLFWLVFSPFATASDTVTIAVASNFHATANRVAERFTAETGVAVRLSAGSTGKLYAQILNGAPYDAFLAADVDRPQKLINNRQAVGNSLFVYAVGELMLWSIDERFGASNCAEALIAGDFSHLAIANPQTAPYGMAAREYLLQIGAWKNVRDKIVYGENISQAFSFVATGNADLGLVAASQIVANSDVSTTCAQRINGPGAPRIEQAAVLLSRAETNDSAIAFLDYLQSAEIKAMLVREGYALAGSNLSGRN